MSDDDQNRFHRVEWEQKRLGESLKSLWIIVTFMGLAVAGLIWWSYH